ncbi:MAG: MFS transporter [Gammaproteobacteria bacterium]|nr:MAG: MFS transporter [Gammaproteobacteria bacterium]
MTAGGATALLQRLVPARPGEVRALAWSFLYFFSLLCGYYVLRPVRDEMGIQGGVENLQWVFTGTFVVMIAAVPLYGWAVARLPRRRLLPAVYLFFIANLLIFYLLMDAGVAPAGIARAFFIWVSVFNLFVVSVFWSFMADLYSNVQARRLFGFIAAGGSAGAVTGPALTTALAPLLGPANLLLVSAVFLAVALLCIGRLLAWSATPAANSTRATAATRGTGGGLWAGLRQVLVSRYLLGICLYILLYTTLSTFLYFEQAHIVRDAFADPGERTRVFAAIDLAVNSLTIILQVFLTAHVVRWLGVGGSLALVPLGVAAGLVALGAFPGLVALISVQVLRRAGNYAVSRPAREMLFTVVDREERYKAKNVIDTLVYRGGDAASAWLYTGLAALGLGLGAIAFIAVPLALLWAYNGVLLGRHQERLRGRGNKEETAYGYPTD